MLEWLKGDPLNGIVLTVSFFSSMIIGRYIRRRISKKKKIMVEK